MARLFSIPSGERLFRMDLHEGRAVRTGSDSLFLMNLIDPSRLERFWLYVSDHVMHGRSWWITDDLKRPVRCFRPSLFSRGDDLTGGTMSLREYQELRKILRQRSAGMTLSVYAAWFMVVYSCFKLIELALILIRNGVRPNFVQSLVISIAIGLAGLFAIRGLGNDPEAIAKELKARGRCASCAFDLSESIPVDGSIARCPECEARWRIAPVQTSA